MSSTPGLIDSRPILSRFKAFPIIGSFGYSLPRGHDTSSASFKGRGPLPQISVANLLH